MASTAAEAAEEKKREARKSCYRLVWQRAGTGAAKSLRAAGPATAAAEPTRGPPQGRPLRPSEQCRPVALSTHTYTYVFSRLQHHTHRTQLRRTFCEGLHGAPPAEPNSGFYTELDERLRLQHSTLAAVRDKSAADVAVGAGRTGGDVDTVALRKELKAQALEQQVAFFTACMQEWCTDACSCSCSGCGCSCATSRRALHDVRL